MNASHPEPDASGSTAPAADAPAPGDFARLALWMAGSLAGLMTAVLVSQGPFYRSLAAWVGGTNGAANPRRPRGSRAATKPTPEQALPMLAEAIVGNSKATVASVFGPPRGAVMAGSPGLAGTYWDADTWYYALPKQEWTTIIIDFAEDYAADVQVLKSKDEG